MSCDHVTCFSTGLEQKVQTRVRELVTAARLMLEGDSAQSVAAINRFLSPDFKDPEGLFYAARHLARLKEDSAAIGLLERVVAGGFFCFPAMASDPWLDPIAQEGGVHEAASSGGNCSINTPRRLSRNWVGTRCWVSGLPSASLAPAGRSGVKPA